MAGASLCVLCKIGQQGGRIYGRRGSVHSEEAVDGRESTIAAQGVQVFSGIWKPHMTGLPSQSFAAYGVEEGQLHHFVVVQIPQLSGAIVARLDDFLAQLLLYVRVETELVKYTSERVGRRVHRSEDERTA